MSQIQTAGTKEYSALAFQKKCFCSMNVSINNQLVSPTSTAKYLGLTLDSKVMFNHHILLVIKKLSRPEEVLCKLRYYGISISQP